MFLFSVYSSFVVISELSGWVNKTQPVCPEYIMASAPPMEPDHFGQPQPPTYEETMKASQYAYSPTPPPIDGKTPQPFYPPPQAHQPFPTGTYSQMHSQQSNAAGTSSVGNIAFEISFYSVQSGLLKILAIICLYILNGLLHA